MRQTMPVRLGAAEDTLIAQLKSVGADATAERITVAGLPTRRVESYHYTDLKTLLKAIPPLAAPANQVDVPVLDIPGAYNLFIVNGVAQQQANPPAGVVLSTVEGSTLSHVTMSWFTSTSRWSSRPCLSPLSQASIRSSRLRIALMARRAT